MEMKITCKIYKLINKINGKIYIGQTWMENVNDRMGSNGNGYLNSVKIYNAIKKYGSENFSYKIIHECFLQEEADEVESFYIKKYNSKNDLIGYNIKDGGSHGKHSEESKEKIANSLKGKEKTEQTRERLSIALKGVNSYPRSEEFKEKVSEAMIEWHKNNIHPLSGVPRTEEQKQAQSEKMSGRPHDPIVVEKRNKDLRKKFAMTEEEELKVISLYNLGKGIKEISQELHINNRKIYRVFEKHNVQTRKRPVINNNSKWKNHNDNIKLSEKEIIDLYLQNTDLTFIIEKFKISFQKLYSILEENNIQRRAKVSK